MFKRGHFHNMLNNKSYLQNYFLHIFVGIDITSRVQCFASGDAGPAGTCPVSIILALPQKAAATSWIKICNKICWCLQKKSEVCCIISSSFFQDAIPVHGAGGILGTIVVHIFKVIHFPLSETQKSYIHIHNSPI